MLAKLAAPVLLTALAFPLWSDSVTALMTNEQKEEFLKTGVVKGMKAARKGITGTMRVTLTSGNLTHDVSVQRIDEEKARFEGTRGMEIGFRDTYRFNIAAYKLGCLLGLGHMIPPSIERSFQGSKGSFSWWVDDFLMDDGDRLKNKVAAPDKDNWARQYLIMKVFDQLIYNTDRNMGNILYDKNWNLWMIDHGRAFRRQTDLLEPKSLEKCDRVLLARMKALTREQVKEAIGDWVRPAEIQGLMARRDKIVDFFEKAGPDRLYDLLPKN
jgi:hypothetical protein